MQQDSVESRAFPVAGDEHGNIVLIGPRMPGLAAPFTRLARQVGPAALEGFEDKRLIRLQFRLNCEACRQRARAGTDAASGRPSLGERRTVARSSPGSPRFMGPLARAGRGRAPRTGAFELWKSGIVHGSSVAQFPYFSNQLSSPAIRTKPLPHAEERGRSPARDGRSSERPMASRLEACSRSGRRSCAWSALRDAPSALLGTREVKYPKLSASRTISRRSR